MQDLSVYYLAVSPYMYIEVRNDFVYFDSDVKQVIYQFGV
jgi:hypothetical protein